MVSLFSLASPGLGSPLDLVHIDDFVVDRITETHF
jgi:hypothetical protein